MTPTLKTLACGAAALGFGLMSFSASAANIMFVMDASGSMKKDAGNGYSRMDNAQYAIARMLTDVDDSNKFGLTVYGHRKAKACDDIQVVADVGSVNAGFVNEFVQQLEAKGETPIAESVRLAAAGFEKFPDEDNQIVLVTDGIEECGGDVCALADELVAQGIGLKVNVVGFTLNEQQQQTVKCLSGKTGGKYYDAQDAKALEAAFTQVRKDIVEPVAKPVVQPVSSGPGVWFEDGFDGEALGEAWTMDNANADTHAVEDGKLLVLFPDMAKKPIAEASAENILKLNAPMPKGDWTATARMVFTAQTHGEWLRMGLSDGLEKTLFASLQMSAYNYASSGLYVRVDKAGSGSDATFNQVMRWFESRDMSERSAAFDEAVDALLLKLEKKGRSYTVSAKIEGKPDAKWVTLQKVNSIRSPGKYLTFAFGSNSNDYVPNDGEGYVELDWVKVTQP